MRDRVKNIEKKNAKTPGGYAVPVKTHVPTSYRPG